MGIGRRNFLKLFGATIAAAATHPLEAMKKMGALMQNPEEMNAWVESRRETFNELPDL